MYPYIVTLTNAKCGREVYRIVKSDMFGREKPDKV